MKILVSSHLFAPSVGGIEQVSGILAEEFATLGHEVRVMTRTRAENEPAGQKFQVIRQPSIAAVFRLLRWCDVYLQSNISLGTLWPALLMRTPTMITYHTWLTRPDGSAGWQDGLKRRLARFAAGNFAVSRALATTVFGRCDVIPNPYRDDLFKPNPAIRRERDLVFLGRLVSDKGADVLVEALARLRDHCLAPTLTIIGGGPEQAPLEQLVRDKGLEGQVRFAGKLTGQPLVDELCRHRVMVVPSRWQEPFGLVALEGMACGLVPVVSSGGGLPEAIGGSGLTFPNGDACALADRIREVMAGAPSESALLANASAHLARHTRRAVAETYLTAFNRITRRLA